MEQAVTIKAKNLGLTKSELVRQSISDHMARSHHSHAWIDSGPLIALFDVSDTFHNKAIDFVKSNEFP